MSQARTLPTRLGGILLAASLAWSLAACAPEPAAESGAVDESQLPGEVAGQTGGKAQGDTGAAGGSSWQQSNPPEVSTKVAELPASFPKELFALPVDAVIDDARERSTGEWYLVLRAADQRAANDLWERVIATNGFAVSDEFETADGGRAATLTKPGLAVSGFTISGDSGAVMLSYDLEATA